MAYTSLEEEEKRVRKRMKMYSISENQAERKLPQVHFLDKDFQARLQSEIEEDWTRSLQQSVRDYRSLECNTGASARENVFWKLLHVSTNFAYAVKTFAQVIISELHLPDESKSIKPRREFRGIGGLKYKVNNIFFKFVQETEFNDYNSAFKIAGHELKGLIHLFNTVIRDQNSGPQLQFPMMTLIDYRGYRVIATSYIPISKDTQKYGRRSDPETDMILSDHPVLEEQISRNCKTLNLKGHLLKDSQSIIFSPFDLEGHVIVTPEKQEEYYLLDFSRVFPPQSPRFPKEKNSHLFELLRPEFVKKNSKPLSSDAFSGYSNEEDEKDIKEATKYLLETRIPEFVDHLCQISNPVERRDIRFVYEHHAYGINARYIGHIRHYLLKKQVVSPEQKDACEFWQMIALISCVARTVKSRIRDSLRSISVKTIAEAPFKQIMIHCLNHVFGCKSDWNQLKQWINIKFDKALTDEEKTENFPLKDKIFNYKFHPDDQNMVFVFEDGLYTLLNYICQELGIKLRKQKAGHRKIFEQLKEPFDEVDLESMEPTVKNTNFISFCEGFVLKTKARSVRELLKKEVNPKNKEKFKEEFKTLAQQALHKYQEALHAWPNDPQTLRNCGELYSYLEELDIDREINRKRAEKYFNLALEQDREDTNSLHKYAVFLSQVKRLQEAEEYFIKSIQANPKHENAIKYYAKMLKENPSYPRNKMEKTFQNDQNIFQYIKNIIGK